MVRVAPVIPNLLAETPGSLRAKARRAGYIVSLGDVWRYCINPVIQSETSGARFTGAALLLGYASSFQEEDDRDDQTHYEQDPGNTGCSAGDTTEAE
jgi:hypothetical protein